MVVTCTAYLVLGLQVPDLEHSPNYLKHVFAYTNCDKQSLYFEDWLDSVSHDVFIFEAADTSQENVYGFDIVARGVKPEDLFAAIKAASLRFVKIFGMEPKIYNVLCKTIEFQ